MAEDLDGNWAVATDEPLISTGSPTSKLHKKKKKSNLDNSAALGTSGPVTSKSKKKRRQISTEARPEFSGDAREAGAARLHAAWAAEAKAAKLSTLEQGELAPRAKWFVSSSSALSISQLPDALPKPLGAACKAVSSDGKGPSVLILCSSAERAFSIAEDMKTSWGVKKPIVLAKHGGGRNIDQVKRNAAALKGTVGVAIATPSRLLRLADEEHWKIDALQLLVIDLAVDRKSYDMLGLNDPRRDTFTFLRKYVQSACKAGSVQLCFCGSDSKVCTGVDVKAYDISAESSSKSRKKGKKKSADTSAVKKQRKS